MIALFSVRKTVLSILGVLLLFSCAIAQNVGLGTTTPHALLQLSNALANRKIVIFETANNDHQYLGFGNNNGTLRYQVDATAADHVFYAGTSSSTSAELLRIKGNGNVGIGVNPATRLDIAGANGWDLENGEGDVRIGTPSYRLKIGVALGGGGAGAVGIMQAGGIGTLSLGAGNSFLLNLNGPSGFVDFTNNTGGLRINGNAGASSQVLSSNGASGAAQWRSLADMMTTYSTRSDLQTLPTTLNTWQNYWNATMNMNLPQNSKVLLWVTAETIKGCALGPCSFSLMMRYKIDGVDGGSANNIYVQGFSFNELNLQTQCFGPYILNLGQGAHTITFDANNRYNGGSLTIMANAIVIPK